MATIYKRSSSVDKRININYRKSTYFYDKSVLDFPYNFFIHTKFFAKLNFILSWQKQLL